VDQWGLWIDRFGWPGAILVAIGFAGWRVWVFLKPYLARIFDAHLELLSKHTRSIDSLHARHDKHDEDLATLVRRHQTP
jgi:hypothetical protein